MLLGFEARNSPILLAEDWEKIDALGSTVLKLRSYHCIPENIPAIAQRNLVVILRPSSDGDLNPSDCYFEMGEAITKLLDAGVPEILLVADSEPNLHGRPMPPDYWNQIATFFLLVDRQFGEHNRNGRLKYGTPPMALAQGEEAWLAAATVTRMQGMHEGESENFLTGFDFYTLHAYGQLDQSLVDHAIALAQKYAPGLPIVAAEVGDSSNANPQAKAEAIITYLQKLEQAGAYAACLFIVGSHDPQWSGFVLPVDQIRRISAAVSGAEPHPQPVEAAPMRDWTREEIIALIIAYSDAAGVPRRLALAGVIAESGIATDAERFGTETRYAKNLIKAIEQYGIDTVGDWDGTGRPMTGRQAWDALMRRMWPDISFGILQITVQHASFYGDGSSSYENVMGFRARGFDPQATLEWSIPRLLHYYNPRESDADWKALNRWNYPAGNGQPWRGNGDNYRQSLAQADAILASWKDDMTPEQKEQITAALHELWALAGGFRANNDVTNADYIEQRVIRIKQASGLV